METTDDTAAKHSDDDYKAVTPFAVLVRHKLTTKASHGTVSADEAGDRAPDDGELVKIDSSSARDQKAGGDAQTVLVLPSATLNPMDNVQPSATSTENTSTTATPLQMMAPSAPPAPVSATTATELSGRVTSSLVYWTEGADCSARQSNAVDGDAPASGDPSKPNLFVSELLDGGDAPANGSQPKPETTAPTLQPDHDNALDALKMPLTNVTTQTERPPLRQTLPAETSPHQESFSPPAPNFTPGQVRLHAESAETRPSAREEIDPGPLGMGTAKVVGDMKTKQPAESAARGREQALALGADERKAGVAPRDLATLPARDNTAVAISVAAPLRLVDASAVRPWQAAPPMRFTFDEIITQGVTATIVELKKLGAESMAVILKPDEKTELYLMLKTHEGQIQISARLDAGDEQAFKAHWGELQQSLARQGVELSDLDGRSMRNRLVPNPSTSRSETPLGQQQQRHGLPQDSRRMDSQPRLKPPAGSFKSNWIQPVALAAAQRLWVVWA